jgi:MFS family permease
MARPFYGWYVVAAAFAITGVGFGSAYSFSAFVDSLQRDFAASRGSVSLVFSLAGFLYFALGVISGPLGDRWGARRVSVLGMLLVGLGLCAAGMALPLELLTGWEPPVQWEIAERLTATMPVS